MKFYGLKKVTLIDYPGHIGCTVFTHGCTLRCPFCHNPELVIERPVESNTIDSDELLEFLERRKGKLDGVVFTGGEPLMNNLTSLLQKISTLGLKIKIDTNGTFPAKLQKLLDDDFVDFVAMDFKTDPKEYSSMGATDQHLNKVMTSLDILKGSRIDYEIRTTLVPGIHTIQTLEKMMEHLKDIPRYVLQNFEPNGTIDPSFKKTLPFPMEELRSFLSVAKRYNEHTLLRA